jgi:hypothetical protein
MDSTNHQAFFTPVKLEGLTQVELERNKRFDVFASVGTPGTNEVCDTGVATGIAAGLELNKQRPSCTSVLFVAAGSLVWQ